MCMVDSHCTVATIWKRRNRQNRMDMMPEIVTIAVEKRYYICMDQLSSLYTAIYIHTTKNSNSTKSKVIHILVVSDISDK